MAELFSTAFANLMTGTNIFLMLVGVVVGIIFGCVPGLSAAMAIALFLPVTFGLPQYSAFALLMALYIGGVSGSLISAILINVPGSSQQPATTATPWPSRGKHTGPWVPACYFPLSGPCSP